MRRCLLATLLASACGGPPAARFASQSQSVDGHFTLEVPAGTQSLVARFTPDTGLPGAGAPRVLRPDGQEALDADRVLGRLVNQAVVLVAHPDRDVEPGQWDFDFGAGQGTLELRSRPASTAPGALHVAVVLTRKCGYSMANDGQLALARLAAVQSFFSQVGVSVADGRVVEISGAGASCDVDELEDPGYAALSEFPANPLEVRLVLVTTVAAALEPADGLARLPGAAGMPGESGAVGYVSQAGWSVPGVMQGGEVLAHEAGHVLGLRHTTERDGTNDTLEDTPDCSPAQDSNGDGAVSAAECPDGGAMLMFWSLGGNQLSAAQAGVMKRSVLLH